MNQSQARGAYRPRTTGETVGVTIIATGPQAVTVYVTGTGQGAHLAVVTASVMVTVHDQAALRTYASIWSDMRADTLGLPRLRSVTIDKAGQQMPGLVVVAHGADRAVGLRRTARNDIAIRIGYVTWILADMAAFLSMTEAWEQAHRVGITHLPKTARPARPGPQEPDQVIRQQIFPTTPTTRVAQERPAPKPDRAPSKYEQFLAYLSQHREGDQHG